jgi:hypothetical protein
MLVVVSVITVPANQCHGKPGKGWALINSDNGIVLALQEVGKLAVYDIKGDSWTVTNTPELNSTSRNRKVDILEVDEDRIALLHLSDWEDLNIHIYSRKKNKFIDQGKIEAKELGLSRFSHMKLSGVGSVSARLYLFLSPLPKKTQRITRKGLDITIKGRPTAAFKNTGRNKNLLAMPSHTEAFYFHKDLAICWASIAKAHIGYVYHLSDKLLGIWEFIPKVPHPKNLPPFGGLTPRGGYRHCFSGDLLFIHGGYLLWSSAVGMSRNSLRGLCYSVSKRSWRILPKTDGTTMFREGGMCWTGAEAFVPGLKTCSLFNPGTWKWRAVDSRISKGASKLICSCVSGKVYIFGLMDQVEKKATISVDLYDPVTNQWEQKTKLQCGVTNGKESNDDHGKPKHGEGK